MLGQAHRFHGYGSLRFVYSNGRAVRGLLVSVRFCKNPKRQNYRVAVVVSKKINKSAVVRNRIRRRIYTLVREANLASQPAYDIVITANNEKIANMEAAALKQELYKLLDRTEVIRGNSRGIIETKES